MSKSKLMVLLSALLVTATGAVQAQTAYKIGYVPTSVGQALTQAWRAGAEKTHSRNSPILRCKLSTPI